MTWVPACQLRSTLFQPYLERKIQKNNDNKLGKQLKNLLTRVAKSFLFLAHMLLEPRVRVRVGISARILLSKNNGQNINPQCTSNITFAPKQSPGVVN